MVGLEHKYICVWEMDSEGYKLDWTGKRIEGELPDLAKVKKVNAETQEASYLDAIIESDNEI